MATYVVRTSHPPDQCPSSNSKVREHVQQAMSKMPQLVEQLGVRLVAGPFVLGNEHEGVIIAEADRIEAVSNLALQGGLGQWNTVRISPAKPMQEALAELEQAPPPLY